MVSKIIKELRSKDRKNIPSILMLLNQFQVDEVIKDDTKIVEKHYGASLPIVLPSNHISHGSRHKKSVGGFFFARGWLGFVS